MVGGGKMKKILVLLFFVGLLWAGTSWVDKDGFIHQVVSILHFSSLSSLPTSGNEGTVVYYDHSLYVATETVKGVESWVKLK